MDLEHHRDLAHEFPELKQRVHDLKLASPEFRHLYADYQALDNEVHRIEQEIETPSDVYVEELKWRRAHLKDRLYGLLTGRLHPSADTEEYVIRHKFRPPVDHGEVQRDWHERGYDCAGLDAAPGVALPERTQATNALLTVVEGGLAVAMHGVSYVLLPGDELFIPRDAPHSIRNPGAAEAHWLQGHD